MGIMNFLKSFQRQKAVGVGELQSFLMGDKVSDDGLDVFEFSLYVNACVRKRAEKIGGIDWVLKNQKGEEMNAPILDLIYKPNRYQDKNEFFGLAQTYKDLAGVAYFLCSPSIKNPKEIFLLNPKSTREKWVNGVFMGVESGNENGTISYYNAEQVFFSKYFSPKNQTQSLSMIAVLLDTIKTERDLARYQSKVIENGGKVGGTISFPGDLTPNQIDDLERNFKKRHTSADNANKLLVLTGGATFSDLGLSPSELSFIESKKFTRDDIMLAFGVPKPLLAVTDDVNLANAEVALQVFLRETIKPLVDNIQNKFNEFLVPEGLDLVYVPFIKEDTDEKLKYYENGLKNGWLAINEVRELEGYEAIQGGDVPMVGFNLNPLGTPVEQEPTNNVDNLKNPEKRKIYYKNWLRRQATNEAILQRFFQRFFDEQKKRVVSLLPINKGKFKKVENPYFNDELEINLLQKELIQYLIAFTKDGGNEAVRNFDLPQKFMLTPARESAIEHQTGFLSKEITNTTRKRLDKVLRESIDNGLSYEDVSKQVQGLFENMGKKRALTIARTTTVSAMQSGVFDSYKQNIIPIKIWVSVGDERTRDAHAQIDGEERPLDIPFSNGLMYPGDPNGPAEQTINCRCSI